MNCNAIKKLVVLVYIVRNVVRGQFTILAIVLMIVFLYVSTLSPILSVLICV